MNIAEIRQQYPEYNDMSDAALAQALHQKFYSDMPADEFAAKIGLSAPTPEKQGRGAAQELGRQAGLTARYGLEGPLSLANAVIGDPASTAINYGLRAFGAPEMPLPSAVIKRYMDQIFPSPETPTEEVVGAISKGLSGGGPITAAAQRTGQVAQATVPMLRSIAASPVADILSSGVGAGGSELAKQMGGGPAWQLAAGAIAPMGVSAAAAPISMGASALNELRRPLTRGGQEQIAADVLGRMTQDKATALRNLERYNQLVASGAQVGTPGFKPTAGAVASDYGLIGGQQLISRGDASPQFAQRFAANNEAVATDLAKLNATDRAVRFYENKRDTITAPLREDAFNNAKRAVDFVPVAEQIAQVAATPAGGRAESQKALKWLAAKLDWYLGEGRTDARNAYALHQDIGDLIAGKIKDSNGAALKLAGGLANEVKASLAQEIERAAPGFKKYLEVYSRFSRPIERLEQIKDRLGGQDLSRVTNALPTATPEGATYIISQAQMKKAVQDLSAMKNDAGRNIPLAPRQRDILERTLGNLNAETLAARGGKQPGSDTYQNIASANFMSRILGDTLASSGLGQTLQRPLNFVNKPFEARINDMIVAAFQDPKKMEELLRRARTSRTGIPSLTGILDPAPRIGGGLLGSLIQ